MDIILNANTAELALGCLARRIHLLLREIGRVGVKLCEHTLNGALHNGLHIDTIDIHPIEHTVKAVEFLELFYGTLILLLCISAKRNNARNKQEYRKNNSLHKTLFSNSMRRKPPRTLRKPARLCAYS